MQKAQFRIKKTNRIFAAGFSSVEIILASTLFVSLVLAFVGAYLYGSEGAMLSGNRARAVFYAEEGLEAVRNIRDDDFANLVDGTYGLSSAGNQWNFSGASDTSDIFTRAITVTSAGADRKNITSTVTWEQNQVRTGNVSLTTRLTNWLASSFGDWTNAVLASSLNLSGNTDAVKVQVQGDYAYVLRSNQLMVVDLNTQTALGTIGFSSTAYNLFVLGDYAYVALSNNSGEMEIVNISDPNSLSIVGTYNDAGNDDARGVYVVGDYAYLALNGGNDFSIVDVSDKANPVFVGRPASLSGGAYEVVVDGDYAYLASGNNSQEVQVIDISNPSSPALFSSNNLSGNTDAITLSKMGNYLFVGQGSNFYALDIEFPIAPNTIDVIWVFDTVNDIALDFAQNTYAFVASSNNSAEFRVINVLDPGDLSIASTVDTPGNDNLLGVAYHSVFDRVYGVGTSNSSEFFVFAPQ